MENIFFWTKVLTLTNQRVRGQEFVFKDTL